MICFETQAQLDRYVARWPKDSRAPGMAVYFSGPAWRRILAHGAAWLTNYDRWPTDPNAPKR